MKTLELQKEMNKIKRLTYLNFKETRKLHKKIFESNGDSIMTRIRLLEETQKRCNIKNVKKSLTILAIILIVLICVTSLTAEVNGMKLISLIF